MKIFSLLFCAFFVFFATASARCFRKQDNKNVATPKTAAVSSQHESEELPQKAINVIEENKLTKPNINVAVDKKDAPPASQEVKPPPSIVPSNSPYEIWKKDFEKFKQKITSVIGKALESEVDPEKLKNEIKLLWEERDAFYSEILRIESCPDESEFEEFLRVGNLFWRLTEIPNIAIESELKTIDLLKFVKERLEHFKKELEIATKENNTFFMNLYKYLIEDTKKFISEFEKVQSEWQEMKKAGAQV